MKILTKTVSSYVRIFFLLLTSLFSQSLIAQSTWNADAVNGTADWNTATNWLGGVPQAGSKVTINACLVCPNISSTGNESSYLQINEGGKLTINTGGILTVQNPTGSGLKTHNKATLNVNTGGILSVKNFISEGVIIGGTLSNTGTINVNGGHTGITLSTDGSLSNNVSGVINVSGAILDFALSNAGTVSNHGTMTLGDAKQVGVNQQNGTFVNSKTGTLTITKTGVNAIFSQSSFINNGALNIDNSAKGIYVIFGTFNNNAGSKLHITGSTGLNEGIYVGQATFTNSGEVTIDSAKFLGIEVSDSATFNNRGKLVLQTKSETGILNVGKARFINYSCAYLQSNGQIINYATFRNSGFIREESSGSSMISFNDGVLYNLNGGTFTVNEGKEAAKTLLNIWTGCFSSAWDNSANWASNAVPIPVGNTLPAIIIPDVSKTSGNTPVINNDVRVSQIDIQANASLTVGSKGVLSVTAFLQTPEPLNLNKASTLTIQEGGRLNAFKINNNEGLISNLGTIKITGTAILSGIENNNATINNSGTITNSRLTNSGIALNLGEWTNSEFVVNNSSFSNNGLFTASSGNALQNYGTFTNYTEGMVQISNAEKGIVSDHIFINSGTINIDGTSSTGITIFAGTFTNAKGAKVNISRTQLQSLISFGTIHNSGTFTIFDNQNSSMSVSGEFNNKPTGVINLNNVTDGATFSGIFMNEGKLKVEKSNGRGIETRTSGTIMNESTGSIEIIQARTEGVAIFANLVNKGSIKISTAGTNGFLNSANSMNEVSGIIEINNAGTMGLTNTGSMKNNGSLTIKNAAIHVLINQSGSLNNIESGKITTVGAGLNGLINRAILNNTGLITLETSGLNALLNDSTGIFNNQSCGEVFLKSRFRNTGVFNNEALLRLGSDDTPSNLGTLVNTGIIEDPNNSFEVTRYTNNTLRVRPIAGNAGAAIANALEIGNNTFIQIGKTWFSNASLTDTAGTYNATQNAFSSRLNNGTYKFYFSVSNLITNCTKVVSIPVVFIGTESELRINKPAANTVLEQRILTDVTIFPNPATYEINLQLKGTISKEAFIQIFDLQGNQVFSKKVGDSEEAILPIDITSLNTGMYLLSIQQNGKKWASKRFVVEK